MTALRSEATLTYGDEPSGPRYLGWRIAIYPVALAFGAAATATSSTNPWLAVAFLIVFSLLMLAPVAIRLSAWGGVRRLWRWINQRRLTLTRGGVIFLTATILFGVAAINTGTNLLYLILSMLLSQIVVSGMLSEVVVKGLRISRRVPPYVYAGEEFKIRVLLSNPRRFTPSFALEVREMSGPFGDGGEEAESAAAFVFKLEAGERRTLAIPVKIEARGAYPLSGFILSTRFPFAFFVKFARAELPAEVVVFPQPRPLADEAVRALGRAEDAPRFVPFHASPDEFRSTRDYRHGDNPRFIHWRSSARRRRLVVKEFEPRATRTSAVVLDAAVELHPPIAGKIDEKAVVREAVRALDRGTTLAASLVEHLSQRGERPELAIAARGEVIRFGAGGGAGASGASASRRGQAAYLEALARLPISLERDFARVSEAAAPAFKRGARVFVLTARDPGALRHALEAAHPSAGQALDVLSFSDEAAVKAFYADDGKEEVGAQVGGTPSELQ